MWTDSHIQTQNLFKLNEHQKISHYPQIQILTNKNLLARSLFSLQKIFPSQYDFFPSTWALPSNFIDLLRYDRQKTCNESSDRPIYIFKPEAKSQGKGIRITDNIEQLEGKNGIAQVYINDPFLIEGLKFDLRIYVLIMGSESLRIFVYKEGLVRFATENYQKAQNKNVKNVRMHLTNYAINKNSKNFVFNKSHKNMNEGHKRSITATFNYLKKLGKDTQQLQKKIDSLIIKTVLVAQPTLVHQYSLSQANTNLAECCFQILGFDILINQAFNPVLLEVNHTPSLIADTPLDHFIKRSLIKDTFRLLNVNVKSKREKVEKQKQFQHLRSIGKMVKITQEQKEIEKNKNSSQRDEYQKANLGNFKKLFPLEKNAQKFQELRKYSKNIFNEQNRLLNKQLDKNSLKKKREKIIEEEETGKFMCKKQQKNKAKQKQIFDNRTINLLKTSRRKLPVLSKTKRNQSVILDYHFKKQIQTRNTSNRKDEHIFDPEQLKINFMETEIELKGKYLCPKIVEFKRQGVSEGIIILSKIVEQKQKKQIRVNANSQQIRLNNSSSMKRDMQLFKEKRNIILDFKIEKDFTFEGIMHGIRKKQRKQQALMKNIYHGKKQS